jgi:uncharacterized protein (DUF58 family)
METSDLLKKVRKIEIKTRGLSRNIFAGQYHTAFKGRGMAFSEVRKYQYGDDVRTIDWNVTARFNHPYIKVFEEERELTVMFYYRCVGQPFFWHRIFIQKRYDYRNCCYPGFFGYAKQRQNRGDLFFG